MTKLQKSLCVGLSVAVMLSLSPSRRDFKIQYHSLFFPQLILGGCGEETDDDEITYGFGLAELLKRIFG